MDNVSRQRSVSRPLSERLPELLIWTGVIGIVAAVGATIFALTLVRQAGDSFRTTLDISGDVATLTNEAVGIAAETVEIAGSSLDQIRDGSGDLVSTFATSSTAFHDAADIVGTDVPATIREVRVTTRSLAQAATSFNNALGTLSIIGVSPPEIATLDSLTEIDRQLDELAVKLEKEGELIAEVGDDFAAFSSTAIVVQEDLERASETLDEVTPLIAGYRQSAREAADAIETAAENLDGQLASASILVIVFGVILAASQLGILLVGSALRVGTLRDAIEDQTGASLAGTSDVPATDRSAVDSSPVYDSREVEVTIEQPRPRMQGDFLTDPALEGSPAGDSHEPSWDAPEWDQEDQPEDGPPS